MNLSQMVTNDVSNALGWALVHSVWQGIGVAMLLAMTLRLMRGGSTSVRYLASCLGLVMIVGSFIATVLLYLPRQRPVAPPRAFTAAVVAEAVPLDVLQAPAPAIDSHFAPEMALPWLVAGWMAGVVALSFWQLGGWILLRRYRRMATPMDQEWMDRLHRLCKPIGVKRAHLRMTDRLQVPIVIGILRPTILMPAAILANLSVQQIEAILSHELAHIRRNDYLINLIQFAIETIFFYHPAVWWISRQIRREREFACDDIAAEVCGDRATYAKALAALEESRAIKLAPAAGGGGRGELVERVRRVLNRPVVHRGSRSHTWVAAGIVVLGCIAMGAWSRNSTAQSGLTPSTQPVNGQSEQSASLGRVVTEGGRPVAGARVYFMSSEPLTDGLRTLGQATTGVDGMFRFSGTVPEVQRLSVLVRAVGFGMTMALTPERDEAEPVETIISPATTARVRFLMPDGTPAVGLHVRISRLQQGQSRGGNFMLCYLSPELKTELEQVTDAEGLCVFPNMPQGADAILEIGDERFARLSLDQRVKLADAPLTDNVMIRLVTAGTISGRVTYADTDQPVVGLRIAANSTGMNNGINQRPDGYGTGVTDNNGRYVLKQLLPENYRIYASLTPEQLGNYAAPRIADARVLPNADTSNHDFQLVRGGIVTGKVMAPPGYKLPSYIRMNGVPVAEDGSYLYHTFPGKQRVGIEYTSLPGLLDPDNKMVEVDVADGQTVTMNFEYRVDPTPGIHGVVVDPDGRPIAGATIAAIPPAGARAMLGIGVTAKSDAQGNFSIPAVADGSTVQASKGRWTSTDPVVVNGEHRSLKIEMRRDVLASVLVKLRLPDGSPAVGASVTLMQRNGAGGTGVAEKIAGADGNVVFKGLRPDAHYDLWAGGTGYGRSYAENLSLVAGNQIEQQIVVAAGTSFIAGIVVDGLGKPVPDIEVNLDGESVDLLSARTDVNGRFRFEGIVPGESFSLRTLARNPTRLSSNVRATAGMDSVVIINDLKEIPKRPPIGR